MGKITKTPMQPARSSGLELRTELSVFSGFLRSTVDGLGENAYNKNHGYGLDVAGNEDKRSSILSDDKKGISIIELEKKEGSTLGLIISGGIDKNCRPKISSLRPGSIAHRSDALAVGDYIISVNGIRTSKLKHEEIVNLLKNAGNKVTLEIEYEIPASSSEASFCKTSKVIQVKLEKEKDSFGFTLRGGACADRLKSRPLTITHVRFGGSADRTGIIKAGDRLLAIDGINLSTASLQEALHLMKQLKQSVLFTIEYDISVIDAVKNATGPLLVEIDKTPGCSLGLNLSCLSVPEHAIIIESIRQASIAERCGALHVGDHVLAIDDIKVDLMTSAEAMQLLRSSVGETVKLEILPVSQMSLRSAPETTVKRGIVSSRYSAARTSFQNCGYNTLSSLGGISVTSGCPYSSITSPAGMRRGCDGAAVCTTLLNPIMPSSSDVSLTSTTNSGCTSVGHADRTEITLPADHKGFGFTLQSSSYPSDILTSPPFVSSIEHGSPAERSGALQVGDRILAVNGESTEGISLDEVTNMIANSHPRVNLITEFDVAEAVVPSSGTFIVKLVKRDADIGISVTAPRNRQVGEPLIISDIKKGSVAHRTGSIQPGDKLLAINSLRTENCTVEDVTAVLLTCTDIVKLRIRKDETFSEDPDATCAIVYTVELVRHGGPLGITVSGTKEPFDPIFISGLTENGLAERTGALHVGDRILAINGNSLRGKTLNEAICILQTCGDAVTLKISKCPCPEKLEDEDSKSKCIHCVPDNPLKSFNTPQPSIDSAVDSWDSCNPGLSVVGNAQIKPDLCGHSASDSNIAVLYHSACDPTKEKLIASKSGEQTTWEQKTHRSNSFSGSFSVPSDEERESWQKVLEDLQTCGQSQLLRQIERTILGFDENVNEVKSSSEGYLDNVQQNAHGTLSENNLQELNSQIEQLNTDLKDNECVQRLIEKALEHEKHKEYALRHNVSNEPLNFYCNSAAFPVPLPVEIIKVTLFKDQVYEDFGFSLSDGKYESGVYINSIRPGGPADMSGLIKPLDRILQVNNVKTYNAGLIVPLIASSGDSIDLVISRPAYDSESSSESTLGRTGNYHPWAEHEGDREGSLSPFSPSSQTLTLTKTL
ncbi:glutamate receptor-interacting protein 2-like isoform X2 [Stegodyphus dumicola]|uniref:glutamate receptor-interacting protein 2-like isoform X2 n=1 Tax=Stegodyphus dumicola TaxID=202533 RepID=UPI0015AD7A8B|nr:glutamate receptor-interacting protein 2-like isoform X2 [Stegodyphus dumicola]